MLEVGNSKHETDGVQNVGLSRTVQSRDRVEKGVKAKDDSPRRVRFETLQGYLLDVHRRRKAVQLLRKGEEEGCPGEWFEP